MNNLHSQIIPVAALTEALTKVNDAYAILSPYMQTLTNEERSDMLKMGDKTTSFVEKTVEYIKTNPEFAPGYQNVADLSIDYTDSRNLISILTATTQLMNGIDDTKMLAGSEAYASSLLYYGSVQRAVDMNVPGAKAIYEELRARFPRLRRAAVPV